MLNLLEYEIVFTTFIFILTKYNNNIKTISCVFRGVLTSNTLS